jgi:hypothetical protein
VTIPEGIVIPERIVALALVSELSRRKLTLRELVAVLEVSSRNAEIRDRLIDALAQRKPEHA